MDTEKILMNSKKCQISEHTLDCGFRAVTLENEFLSVTILPTKGADIYQLIYKPRELDLLWKSPWGLNPVGAGISTAATSEEAWLEHYEGGWQEIFPNGGDACVYKGCHLNFHGEVSTLSWNYQLESHKDMVRADFNVSTFRSPFKIKRSMILESGKPHLRMIERISNFAEEEMHFMWGHHPAFGAPFLTENVTIQMPPALFQSHHTEICPLSQIAAGTESHWPMIPGKSRAIDLSRIPPSSERHCEFGYLRELESGWYALSNKEHDFTFGLVWPLEVFPYLWFWQELRGSFGFPWHGRCYVMAIEPFTSIPGTGLENAIASGTAPLLPPGGSVEAELTAMFLPGCKPIQNLTLDGEMH
jgi:hypothetical protein